MAGETFSYDEAANAVPAQPVGAAMPGRTAAGPQGQQSGLSADEQAFVQHMNLAAGGTLLRGPDGSLVGYHAEGQPLQVFIGSPKPPAPASQAAPAAEPATPAPQVAAAPPIPPAASEEAPDEFTYEDAAKGAPLAADARPTSEGLGFVEGVTKPLDNIAGWLNKIIPDDRLAAIMGLPSTSQAIDRRKQAFTAAEQTEKPGAIGQVAGEIAGTLPTMMVPGGILAQGAAAGALLTDKPNDPIETARAALGGAAGGFVGGKVVGAIGKVAAPALKPAVQTLIDAGVPLTPGQIMGGAAKRIEDGLTSWPILGDAIKTAQRRSMAGFNTAAANDALSHIGESVPSGVAPGRGTIAHVEGRLSNSYDAIAPQLRAAIDEPFVRGVADIRSKIEPEALDALPTFDRVVRDEILQRAVSPGRGATGTDLIPFGTAGAAGPQTVWLDGRAAKQAQEAIGAEIRGLRPSADPKTRAVVRGLEDVQDQLQDSLARNSPADAADKLKSVNAGWAKFVRLRDASAAASEKEDGMFTPFKLSQAVKRGDKSTGRGAFARGSALMQDLSAAGEQVLPSTVPDSGSAMRVLLTELPMLVGFGAESQHFFPQLAGTLIAGGAAGLPYTRVGQRLVQKSLSRRPWSTAEAQAAMNIIRPYLTDAGAVQGQSAAKRLPQLPPR